MELEVKPKNEESILDETTSDKDTKRSLPYPARTQIFTLSFVEKIYKELGSSDYHSKEDIAKAHKLAVPSVKTTLSTAQQYGLLEIKHGTGYKVTPLAIKIFHPENDTEKINSIIESLKEPTIFKELMREFNNQVVPSMVGITNIIIRRYKFKDVIAEKIAEIFVDNLKQYNLINAKNILTIDSKSIGNSKSKLEEPLFDTAETFFEKKDGLDKVGQTPKESEKGIIDIVIPLKSSAVKAHLLIPEDYTSEDLVRIKKFVDALE